MNSRNYETKGHMHNLESFCNNCAFHIYEMLVQRDKYESKCVFIQNPLGRGSWESLNPHWS
jgi:hypothetical protein